MTRTPPEQFWSVVRPRHPDIDVLLLPAPAPEVTASGLPVVELTTADEVALAEEAASLWRALAREEPPRAAGRWVSGSARDVVRREHTLLREGLDAVAGVALVRGAVASLRAQGWRVLAPPDGMPRALASREVAEGRVGREELLLVLVPGPGRLVMRHRSAGLPVGRSAARDLVTGVR